MSCRAAVTSCCWSLRSLRRLARARACWASWSWQRCSSDCSGRRYCRRPVKGPVPVSGDVISVRGREGRVGRLWLSSTPADRLGVGPEPEYEVCCQAGRVEVFASSPSPSSSHDATLLALLQLTPSQTGLVRVHAVASSVRGTDCSAALAGQCWRAARPAAPAAAGPTGSAGEGRDVGAAGASRGSAGEQEARADKEAGSEGGGTQAWCEPDWMFTLPTLTHPVHPPTLPLCLIRPLAAVGLKRAGCIRPTCSAGHPLPSPDTAAHLALGAASHLTPSVTLRDSNSHTTSHQTVTLRVTLLVSKWSHCESHY
ncbi:hypothetical protein HaLaN_02766 [Haematococcus lacustris]|uniref:Uncharacterized protein n=1 Tax=Haematococcus lacustris TaxID=44745 RepID=A0A699YCZ0_HAELA|nr:hypothetical protein HaLaN_02766 [Haematococcus lacustris]